MKVITLIIWLASGVLLQAADSIVRAVTNALAADPIAGPPGTLLGVMRGADMRTLVVRYELAGITNEQSLKLTNDIADFHFCSWMQNRGVAFAISETDGDVYWAASYFARLSRPIYPRRIRSPGGYKLMGIANTGGDTVVITAIDHRRSDTEVPVRGWMYINYCPPASDIFLRAPTNAPTAQIQMSGFDHLMEFEVPRRKAEPKK